MKVIVKEFLKKEYFKHFLYNPNDFRFILDYLLREVKISNITEERLEKIKIFLKEAEEVRKVIVAKISKLRGFHGAMISPLEGPVIYTLIRVKKPEIVVETGVANGASTTFILKALEKNNYGKLFSIDLPQNFLMVKEVGWLVPRELRHRWKLLMGDSKIILPNLLKDLGKVDIFIHDSLHTLEHVIFELKTASQYMNEGFLLADDVDKIWINEIISILSIKQYQLFYDFLVLKKCLC